MNPAEEHSWKPQHSTQDVLVRMVDEWGKALDGNKLFGSCQARAQQDFWLGKSLDSTKEDGEMYGVKGGEWSGFKITLLAEGRGHVWERRNENGLMLIWMYLRDQSWVCFYMPSVLTTYLNQLSNAKWNSMQMVLLCFNLNTVSWVGSSLASQPTSAQREGSGQLSIQVLSPAH